ncbi:MAG: putative dehydrogenase [Cyclobacteriaceae bacterium]|jgi:predicted dehydrogenase
MKKLKWGILSTAKIGIDKVIPGMLKSEMFEVAGIASRNLEQAKNAASQLGIARAYGSYDELLGDPEIDIIYNPLPNHLHVEWTAKAIEAGKHVLCEKPLFINPADSATLINLRDKHNIKVGEAFMVKSHPQWTRAKEICDSGDLGEVILYNASFTYYNTDPDNIRNIAAFGGGALWDIGCYPVMTSMYLFAENPSRVFCEIKRDPQFGTDVFSSAILEFPSGKRAIFTVSTQLAPYQRVHILGTKKELEIQIPFNSPTDRPSVIKINFADILQENLIKENIPTCDQYQLQAEAFTEAVLNNTEVPVSLEDALDHSRIITALFESASVGQWKTF